MGIFVGQLPAARRHLQAGQHAHQIDGEGRAQGLVEIIHVEVDQAVVALEAAVVLQVQVAADEGARRLVQQRRIRHRGGVQVVGATKEREWIVGHGGQLAGEPLGIAAGVVFENGAGAIVHEAGLSGVE